jgi:signal transduction histidine kinase
MIDTMTSARERIGKLDVAITAVFFALAVLDGILNVNDDEVRMSVVGVPFFAALALPLLWRRVAPLAALGATLVVLLVHFALFTDAVRCGIVLPAMFLLVFAAGARLDRDRSLLGLALALALGLAVCLTDGPTGAPPELMVFVGPMTLAVWGVGRLVHSRGRMVGELETRTGELRAARDERARLEVATDRARLSAELDELLQRRLAELAQLADEGALDRDSEVAAARLAEIERASRRTLEEMRAVVGVLRSDETEAPMAPQPTLTHLEAMLVRAKGAAARLSVEGNPRALPAGVELSAYRIVEYLLDALDDDSDVDVRVRFADDALELSVAGAPRRRGEEAIDRARERVRLHRGTLHATTEDGRAETVVSLPILAAV